MSEPHVFRAWTAAVVEKADAALTDIEEKKGRIVAVVGGHGDLPKSVSELATRIRYSPPPPGTKPVEPWFDDQSEDDDDGGPETTH